jgi:uncharacterized protein
MKIEDSPKDCIRTNSGLFMNVFNPTIDMVCIEDIAHALSSIPRFGGHLNRFYSVAQHSIHCAERAKPNNKIAALLHDGSEAFMLDIPTPIKARLPKYKKHEHELMKIISNKFGFKYPFNREIKIIDKYMLKLEWRNLVVRDDKSFKCMTQNRAKKEFLKLYYELLVTPNDKQY